MRVFTALDISSGLSPTEMMLWASWATLEAIAPLFKPKPVTKPVATGALRYRFTTERSRMSRLRSGITRPPFTLSVAVSLRVRISSRTRPITLAVTEGPGAGTAKSSGLLGDTGNAVDIDRGFAVK